MLILFIISSHASRHHCKHPQNTAKLLAVLANTQPISAANTLFPLTFHKLTSPTISLLAETRFDLRQNLTQVMQFRISHRLFQKLRIVFAFMDLINAT